MDGVQTVWQAVVIGEALIAMLSGGLTAAFFLYEWRTAVSPGRRTAALALALTGLGNIAQARAALTWQEDAARIAATGLPACLGQVLVALLVLRQMARR